MEADAAVIASVCWQRGQGNFELAANFGYSSRGSADPRESLRKRRISKLALSARKVLPPPDVADRFRILFFTWGGVKQIVDGRRKSKKKYRVRSRRKDQGEFLHIKMATGHVRFGCHFCMG